MLRSIVRRTPELQVKLRNLVKSERVVLFMKGTPEAPQCGFSRKVIQAMHSIHFDDFTYVDVIKSEAVREAVKEYSEWPTIPQLFVDGEFVGGCDIVLAMHEAGELKELLVKE
eukprot:GEMP01067398.1.p1 GENE.GEMP01067398.1~~GEMP01067398.1.p1  ORF type:complete len:120 (+),score=20.42 GEMP01067398.1:23-361(+)